MAAALALEGSLVERVGAVYRVHLFVLLGVLLTIRFAPIVEPWLLPQFPLFAALIVSGLAMEMAGLRLASADPLPDHVSARWLWGMRLITFPQVLLPLALVLSGLQVLTHPIGSMSIAVDGAATESWRWWPASARRSWER